ncbi:putative serine protease EDA2 [Capsicum chinense]|nr:putative serine protease EDA2 [Capsicum chinense]
MTNQFFVNKSGSQKEVEDILRWGTEELFRNSSSMAEKDAIENSSSKDKTVPEVENKRKRSGSLCDMYKDKSTTGSTKIMWDESAILKLLDCSNLQSESPDNNEAELENDMLGSVKDHRTFGQRYYEFLDYFRFPDGPIFLKICGEAACSGIPNDYLSILAKKFGAAVVTLEHRYYGKSSPFKSLTTGNLKYLSSKQALFDLAAFRNFYQESLNAKLTRSNIDNPWFVFGVSYAGALSAWFRLKFPHLTCGSLASSAVVQAVYSFSEFDKQVGESAGPECKAALQEITQLVEARLASNGKELKALFGADEALAIWNLPFLISTFVNAKLIPILPHSNSFPRHPRSLLRNCHTESILPRYIIMVRQSDP